MPKRKDPSTATPTTTTQDDSDSSSSDVDMLNVDFEWFDPASIDFHGLKLLLRQLLDADSDLFDLSALADLIISQPTLGSTVKVSDDASADTKDTDPYAFLSILNLHAHKEKEVIQQLTRYLVQKCAKIGSLATLPALLQSDAQVGLVLTERLINMPTEIVPPMYAMLLEEIEWAVKDNEPYNFTHYLIISKVYTEIASRLDVETEEPAQKKSKKSKAGASSAETFFFHPEDEVLQEHALGFGHYEYVKPWAEGASDAKRAFQEAGIRPLGSMVLIEAAKFQKAVDAVKAYVG